MMLADGEKAMLDIVSDIAMSGGYTECPASI
jgi:hypothetical protein